MIVRDVGQHFIKRTQLALALPRTRDKLVRQPLLTYLHQGANNRKLAAADYAMEVFDRGVIAPRLAVRTIEEFETRRLEKGKEIPAEKRIELLAVKKQLRLFGRLMLGIKLILAAMIGSLVSVWISLATMPPIKPPNYEHNPNTNVYDPAPLQLTVYGKEYVLYGGEEWNGVLREECRDFFTLPDRLTEQQLVACWQEHFVQSLADSKFPQYLDELDQVTVEITAEMRAETIRVKQRLTELPVPKLGAISTKFKDDSVDLYNGGQPQYDLPNYATYYAQVYGVSAQSLPALLGEAELYVAPPVVGRKTTLAANEKIPLFRVVETDGQGRQSASYVPFILNDGCSYFEMDRLQAAYPLVKYFETEIDRSAEILAQYHPQALTRELFKLAISYKMISELARLRFEDPWQDISACAWSGCSLEEKFESVFADVEYGVRIWGKLWDLPWRLASALHTSKDMQGFGPNQVIFGLFKAAAADPNIRQHFSTEFSAEVFEDEKAIMRAILEQPALSFALVYDHVLSQMEATTLSDPAVRYLPILPPFLHGSEAARLFTILEHTLLGVTFPEFTSVPTVVFAWPDQHIGTWQFMSDIFGGSTVFPGTVAKKEIIKHRGWPTLMTYSVREKSDQPAL